MPETVALEAKASSKYILFPLSNIKNISLFYVLTALNNCWFIAANWIFFWLRFMNYGQLGLMDAAAFAFGLLMEVPSGAVSDLIGKKKTVVAAMFLASVSVLGFASANSLEQLWIAFLVAQLGWAFYSGAAEALAYDTLVEHKKENAFDEVISFNHAVATITTITAILLGGIMFVIHFRLPHYAWGFAYFCAFLVSLFLQEPKVDTEHFSLKNYFKQLRNGIKELFKPSLRAFVIVILALMGTDYLYNWGIVKPAIAIRFGFFDREQAILFALYGIIGATLVGFIPTFRRYVSDKKGLYILTLLMGGGFLLSYFDLGYYGIFAMLLINIAGYLAYPWISIVVNKEIPSHLRATTLSTVALITKLPYTVLAIVVGRMVENNTFHLFNLWLGLFIVGSIGASAIIVYFSKYR